MVRRPKFAKPDANQQEIVDDCRDRGMVVWNVSAIGGRVLDLVIWWRGLGLPFEVKRPGLEEELTAGETEGIRDLAGVGVEARVVTCVEEVIAAFEEAR